MRLLHAINQQRRQHRRHIHRHRHHHHHQVVINFALCKLQTIESYDCLICASNLASNGRKPSLLVFCLSANGRGTRRIPHKRDDEFGLTWCHPWKWARRRR